MPLLGKQSRLGFNGARVKLKKNSYLFTLCLCGGDELTKTGFLFLGFNGER